MNLEEYFLPFKEDTIGNDLVFDGPYGKKKIIYADWIASGRLYRPIEEKMLSEFYPLVGNTHSESSVTGTTMTLAYHQAHEIIKKHCNAGKDDVIITAGSGMTGMICKFQRLLGLKVPEQLKDYVKLSEEFRPLVIVTHMEHHSNQTSWLETIADVIVLAPDKDGLVDLNDLENELKKHQNRKLKIGAFTACSNVTGIETPIHQMAKIMHQNDGYCFVDYACSAPYAEIDMHPEDELMKLDAIFFSPHKFLGGPGSSGVMIFDSQLYKNKVPDQPGGGTVDWTNPWGQHKFVSNIEAREDGGTPAFLQAIRAALCIKLKEEMGVEKMRSREEEMIEIVFNEFPKIPGVHILADNVQERLGAISFYVDNIHYNLVVKLLNDRFGIQVRGGCSCAGTYGHYLLHIDPVLSKKITDKIDLGDFSERPGWVRMSIHPTMTNKELYFIIGAIKEIVQKIDEWKNDYLYNASKNEFYHKSSNSCEKDKIINSFELTITNPFKTV